MVYPFSTETPNLFVTKMFTIFLQICFNFCQTPRFWTDNECAVLKINTLIDFKTFFCSGFCSIERNMISIVKPCPRIFSPKTPKPDPNQKKFPKPDPTLVMGRVAKSRVWVRF